jgi:hypothetical protein
LLSKMTKLSKMLPPGQTFFVKEEPPTPKEAARPNMADFEVHLLKLAKESAPPTPMTKQGVPQTRNILKEQCHAAMESGELDSRCALGLRFARAVKDDKVMEKAFKKVQGNASKLEFRLKWAKETYDKLVETKTYSEELTERELDEGVYEPLDTIFQKEGSTQSAWTRAMNYAEKATRMGGAFTRTNMMTSGNGESGLEFLYFKKKSQHIFERCWGLHQTQSKESDSPKAAIAAEESSASVVNVTPAKASKTPLPTVKGKRAADSAVVPGSKPKKAKNEILDVAIAAAKKVKVAYAAAINQYTSIQEAIATIAAWTQNWPAENVHRMNMEQAKASLDAAAMPVLDWLIYDFAVLKTTHEPKKFFEVINALGDTIRADVEKLAAQCAKVQRMQKESYV